MMSIPVDPLVAFLVIAAGVIGTASGWVVLANRNQAIDNYLPIAPVIRKALTANKGKKPEAILVLMNTGTYAADIFLGKANPENKAVFDLPGSIGEHLIPENTGNIKPMIIYGLRIYFGTYIDAEAMSMDEVIHNNRLIDVKSKIPELRGIPVSTLNALLQQPNGDWKYNCDNLLANIRQKERRENSEYCGIPKNTTEFINALYKAQDMLDKPAEKTCDTIITTYESIRRRPKALPKPTLPFDLPFLKKPQEEEEPALISDTEYLYEHRAVKYRGIKFISPNEAANARFSSLTAKRLQEYGLEREQQGRNKAKNEGQLWFDKYGKIVFTVGFAVFICCLGVGVLAMLLGGNAA